MFCVGPGIGFGQVDDDVPGIGFDQVENVLCCAWQQLWPGRGCFVLCLALALAR